MSKNNKNIITEESQKIKFYEKKIKDLILAYKNLNIEKELLQKTLEKLSISENSTTSDEEHKLSLSHSFDYVESEKILQLLKLISYITKQKGDLEISLIDERKQYGKSIVVNNEVSANNLSSIAYTNELAEKLKESIKERNDLLQKTLALETKLIQGECEFAKNKDELHLNYKEREDALLQLGKEKERRISDLEGEITQIIQTTAIYEKQKLHDSNKIMNLQNSLKECHLKSINTSNGKINVDYLRMRNINHTLLTVNNDLSELKGDLNNIKKSIKTTDFIIPLNELSETMFKTFQKEKEGIRAHYREKCFQLNKKIQQIKNNSKDSKHGTYIDIGITTIATRHSNKDAKPIRPDLALIYVDNKMDISNMITSNNTTIKEIRGTKSDDPKVSLGLVKGAKNKNNGIGAKKKILDKAQHTRNVTTDVEKSPTIQPNDHIYYYRQEIDGKENLIKYLRVRLSNTEAILRESQRNATSLELLYSEQLTFLKGQLRSLESIGEFQRELRHSHDDSSNPAPSLDQSQISVRSVNREDRYSDASTPDSSSIYLYLRNLFLNYIKCEMRDVKARKSIIRAISTVLKFTPDEVLQINKLISN